MKSNRAIGGYLGLELPYNDSLYHDDAYLLNSGRNALKFILDQSQIKNLLVPNFNCPDIFTVIESSVSTIDYYHINEKFAPILPSSLAPDSAILVTNYFGLCKHHVNTAIEKFNGKVIVDNAQAFFYPRNPNCLGLFYSPRKFFGLPDGGLAITSQNRMNQYNSLPRDEAWNRSSHLLKRFDLSPEMGYGEYKVNEKLIDGRPIMKMSKLSEYILRSVDFSFVKERRQSNYKYYEKHLSSDNNLLTFPINQSVPLAYPFGTPDADELKEYLIKNKVYIPTYWPGLDEVNLNDAEIYFKNNLLPLPLHQGLVKEDLNRVIDLILNFFNEK
jgi:hypothetical protein